jgi:hypothetical protein
LHFVECYRFANLFLSDFQVCIALSLLDSRCSQQLRGDASDRELVEPITHPITIFMKEFGAVPAYSTSRYCHSIFNCQLGCESASLGHFFYRMEHSLLPQLLHPHQSDNSDVLSSSSTFYSSFATFLHGRGAVRVVCYNGGDIRVHMKYILLFLPLTSDSQDLSNKLCLNIQ